VYQTKLNIFALTVNYHFKTNIPDIMTLIIKKTLFLLLFTTVVACNAPGGNQNTFILIKTTAGDIKVKLYDATPKHRDNFIKLVNSGFYDGVSFHRIIKNFMIQAGDPATRTANGITFPDSIKTYTIPAEFNSQYFHKKGALAAARQGNDINPEMRSSGTQFYIVQGEKYTDENLNMSEQMINNNIKQGMFSKLIHQVADSIRATGASATDAQVQEIATVKMFDYLTSYNPVKIPEEHRNVYKTAGGTPRLDNTYTVFGEVTEGLDIVDRIAAVTTDSGDKPIEDVKILKMKIVKK
jgi:cyclophilin family peptidyl-prolyl cis-trans isomerase